MKTNIKVDETTIKVYPEYCINKAIEILSLLEGKTVEECNSILGLTKTLIDSNTTFGFSKD